MVSQAGRILPDYGGDAVAITAQATLNPGDSIDLPVDALRNGFGLPALIDAFRWTVDAQEQVESANPPTVTVGFPGASIQVAMKKGDLPITGGDVPIYCLGRSIGQDVEHAILGVPDVTVTEMLLGAYSGGVWEFDHPMSMAPGDAISIHLTHRGLQNLPVTVSLALTGRLGMSLPVSRWIPYATAWVPGSLAPTTPTATAPLVVTSTERDLINRAPSILHVSRFVGRILRTGVSGNPLGTGVVVQNQERVYPSVAETISGQPTSEWFPGAVDSFLSITMRDSRANDNVPIAIPFRLVFEPESRSWECPHDVPPGGYYIAQLSLAVPGVTTDQSIQPAIAMVGAFEKGT